MRRITRFEVSAVGNDVYLENGEVRITNPDIKVCLACDVGDLENKSEETISHQKRKRCLAMADKCYAQSVIMYLKRDTEPVKECAMWYHRRGLWWEKWKREWLALANKFKEAK